MMTGWLPPARVHADWHASLGHAVLCNARAPWPCSAPPQSFYSAPIPSPSPVASPSPSQANAAGTSPPPSSSSSGGSSVQVWVWAVVGVCAGLAIVAGEPLHLAPARGSLRRASGLEDGSSQ